MASRKALEGDPHNAAGHLLYTKMSEEQRGRTMRKALRCASVKHISQIPYWIERGNEVMSSDRFNEAKQEAENAEVLNKQYGKQGADERYRHRFHKGPFDIF